MAIPFFIVKNPLKNNAAYIPRTRAKGLIDQKAFIKAALDAGSGMTGPDLIGALSLIEEILLRKLSDGWIVELGDFMKLRPVIKGSLKSEDMRKNKGCLRVDVNCKVTKKFLKALDRRTKPVKTESRDLIPLIKQVDIRSHFRRQIKLKRSNTSQLGRDYANFIKGKYLVQKDMELKALVFYTNKNRHLIPVSELVIQDYTAGQIIFHFHRDFTPPKWLKADMQVGLFLEFHHPRDVKKLNSNGFVVRWMG